MSTPPPANESPPTPGGRGPVPVRPCRRLKKSVADLKTETKQLRMENKELREQTAPPSAAQMEEMRDRLSAAENRARVLGDANNQILGRLKKCVAGGLVSVLCSGAL